MNNLNAMNPIDKIILNFRNMGSFQDRMKDSKGIPFENGVNLIKALAKVEEKQKASQKKLKAAPQQELLKKRVNPYSRDEDSTEYFYLPKKPQLAPINAVLPPSQNYSVPEMIDLIEFNSGGNDEMKYKSLIRIGGVINFLKLRKKGKKKEASDQDGQSEIGEDVLTQNDYAILNFFKNNEHVLLNMADQWLNQEIANYSFYAKSHKRYFAILDELLTILQDSETITTIFTTRYSSEMLIQFFKQIPLINGNVFFTLKIFIEAIQKKPSEFLTVDNLLDCYQNLLDKFNGQTEAMKKGIGYLMEMGLMQSLKLIRYKYFLHPSFTAIIEGYMQQYIEYLKMNLSEKENENYIKLLMAFALRDNPYLQLMFKNFSAFNEQAKKSLIEKIDKFFAGRFSALVSEDIELFQDLFSEKEQGHELLEKLASYLKLHLPLFQMKVLKPGESLDDVRKAIDQILTAFQKRKRVDFFCSLFLRDDSSKIDSKNNDILQEDIIDDVFIHLHRLAIGKEKNTVMKIMNIIKTKLLEQIPYERILNCLDSICQPSFQGQLSPLSGVTFLSVFIKFKKDKIKPIQELYNELLDKVEILLKNNALNYPDIKDAIVKYLGQATPWPDKAINLINKYIPIDILEEFAKQNGVVKGNLDIARQKNQL